MILFFVVNELKHGLSHRFERYAVNVFGRVVHGVPCGSETVLIVGVTRYYIHCGNAGYLNQWQVIVGGITAVLNGEYC